MSITDKLIAVTQKDIVKGIRNGIGDCDVYEVIRSGIELDRFMSPKVSREKIREELSIPGNVPVIGTVTRLSPQKAPLIFVNAMKEIISRFPDCHFVIVGDGPLRADVIKQISDLGISDHAVLTGIRRDIPELMAAFDIFVLSSLWEGLPRVIPQAMCSGIPVVASDIDGNAEIIDDCRNGRLVPPGNPDALAGAVIELLENPELAKQIGKAGLISVSEFSAQKMVQHISQLYCCLSEKKNIVKKDI
ncbi:MAG: glycosyltransferase [Desulfobacterales bacterium]